MSPQDARPTTAPAGGEPRPPSPRTWATWGAWTLVNTWQGKVYVTSFGGRKTPKGGQTLAWTPAQLEEHIRLLQHALQTARTHVGQPTRQPQAPPATRQPRGAA